MYETVVSPLAALTSLPYSLVISFIDMTVSSALRDLISWLSALP